MNLFLSEFDVLQMMAGLLTHAVEDEVFQEESNRAAEKALEAYRSKAMETLRGIFQTFAVKNNNFAISSLIA